MQSRIVFTRARVLDGDGSVLPNAVVAIAADRIESVTESDSAATRPGDQVIDLDGRTLLPGMTSAHFHTGFGITPSFRPPELGLDAPSALHGMLAAKNIRTALDCGFTNVICSSSAGLLDVCLKQAMLLGIASGPRLLACTREFMTSGEQADGRNRSWFMDARAPGLVRRVDGADEFRRAAREELGRGCDVLKLSVAPGHATSPTADFCYLTPAELAAAVEVAHGRGKLVRAHCPSRAAILACARAGVDIIDHADRIDAECIDAIAAAGSSVCPSMLWYSRFLALADAWDHDAAVFPVNNAFPATREETLACIRGIREEFEHTAKLLPELARSGVRLVIGDDFGTAMMPHGDYVSELELYVNELGIPARDVIRWATQNGAELSRRGDDCGRVAAGRLADLVVVDGDPLADIGALRNPAAVVQNGAFTLEPRWTLSHSQS